MAQYPSFEGTITELITPFTTEGAVDYDLLRGEAEFQVNAGVDGIFTNGVASEGFYLSPEEQVAAATAVVETVAGRLPVMSNVIANTVAVSKDILKNYEALGVQAISFQSPAIYALSQSALFNYYDQLAKTTTLPVCLYNAPQTSNVVAPETVAKLFKENANFMYYKESTIDFVHVQNTMRLIGKDRKMEFLSGSDASTFLIAQLGGKGIVSLISTIFPKEVKAIYDAYSAGNMEEAKKAQEFVLEIREALKAAPFLAGYKYAGSLVGVPLGHVRTPLPDASDAQKVVIKENLTKLGLFK